MPRGSRAESVAMAWWALGTLIGRPHSAGTTLNLLEALTGLGLGSFHAVRSRIQGESWNRRESESSGKWVERLRESLAPLAFSEEDPQSCWNRRWDQTWRLLAFDIPTKPHAHRQKLWRWLKHNRLGLLQRSLWISCKPMNEIRKLFHDAANSHTLLMWEAPTPTGLNPLSIVEQAWDLADLDASYQVVLSLSSREPTPENLRLATYRWQKTIQSDPLLPRCLYPRSFRGFQATEKLEKMWAKFRAIGS